MKLIPLATACFISITFASLATAAEKQKPYPIYWMSVATSNQSIPGMPSGMGGIASLFGGKSMFGPKRELHIQLESPKVVADEEKANQLIPAGQKMGESLPLKASKPEKTERNEQLPEMPEKFEKPKARLLVYWGCGDKVGKGQPKVIDTARMNMTDFGKAFSGRAPKHQTAPAPHKGTTYGEWPNNDDRTDIPSDSSLVGKHTVKGNYTGDIVFNIDQKHDFMAPVDFLPLQKTDNGALKTEWKSIPTATGYFASAMGHNSDSGETIFWSSSEVAETGFSLQNYLANADVSRFIKEKVIMDPSKTSCTIPPIFKEGQMGMMQFIAYGDELNIVQPPKPKDPKKRWDIDWSAKIRLKSTAMLPLITDENGTAGRNSSGNRKNKKTAEPVSTPEEPSSSATGSGSPVLEMGNKLRGMFGF